MIKMLASLASVESHLPGLKTAVFSLYVLYMLFFCGERGMWEGEGKGKGEAERVRFPGISYKDTNPIGLGSFLWLHLTLITS